MQNKISTKLVSAVSSNALSVPHNKTQLESKDAQILDDTSTLSH